MSTLFNRLVLEMDIGGFMSSSTIFKLYQDDQWVNMAVCSEVPFSFGKTLPFIDPVMLT